MGVGMQAIRQGRDRSEEVQGAMAADNRTAKIADASKAALEKSGLTQDEMAKLMRVPPLLRARLRSSASCRQGRGIAQEDRRGQAQWQAAKRGRRGHGEAYSGQAPSSKVFQEFAMQYGRRLSLSCRSTNRSFSPSTRR